MQRFKWVLKLGISALLITWLLRRGDITWVEIRDTLARVDLRYVALAVVLLLNQFVLSSLKWRAILLSHGIRLPLTTLVRAYMIGSFFGTFLPSSYAGDFVRIASVARDTGRTFESAAAVVLERLSGLAALTSVGAIAALHIARVYDEPAFFRLSLVLLAILLALIVVFVPGVLRLVRPLVVWVPVGAVRRLFAKIESVVVHYRNRPRLLVQIMAISFAFQILAYTIFFTHTRALGLNVPYLYCLAFVPIVFLMEALPISIAGVGVRETALIYFLGKLGTSAADALALGILILVARYGLNLLGGVLFVTGRGAQEGTLRENADV